ncbi:transglutaminase family protein [Oscillatoria sp. FACHB-1406]|uniref:transglutaminase family protein n=1 Tax=Oscillatoria sp. FACHB-1406 TaxID=2692846 RepID=UPI0016890365|nr:transglutaminase family protein [Oscillatoria sp. FACHB-1406]
MYYRICHQTTYTYNRSVLLKPHIVRLRPRCDSWQTLQHFSIAVEPEPAGIFHWVDLDGNAIVKLSFQQETDFLKIVLTSEVETRQSNPFNFLLETEALQLPINYPHSLWLQLQPYLQPYGVSFDPVAVQLAQEIEREVSGQPISFLTALNQRLYDNCKHIVREEGDPWYPGVTWREGRGSCRDVAVLFMEVCRCMGLGARFVSGYQEGDIEQERRDLHAWAEVYLPGAGWRGFDPTQGLAVCDRHIAVAASAFPRYAAPISGGFSSGSSLSEVSARLEAQIAIARGKD